MNRRVTRAATAGLLTIALTGCATPYVPGENKDRYPGRIIAKSKIIDASLEEERRKAEAEYQTTLFLFSVGAVVGGAIGGGLIGATAGNLGGPSIPAESYRYTVDTEDSRKMVIINHHSGFKTGDCVSVLVGRQTQQVTMAYGSDCLGNR